MSFARILLFAVLAVGHSQRAQAQSGAVVPHAAPVAWLQYADEIENAFQDKLAGDSDDAKRLRVYFGSAGHGDMLTLGVWVTPGGQVNRVAFAPFLDNQANTDLTHLLNGVKLASAPPQDILLPVRLNLRLGANPVLPSNDDASTPASALPQRP